MITASGTGQGNGPSKPLHHTQKVLANSADGIEITIDVVLNYELEREILGFGKSIVVLEPQRLRERIEKKLQQATEKYLVLKVEEG